MNRRRKEWLLSPRQQRFVEQFSLHGKGRQAALEAGYAESSAKVSASRMLRSQRVQEALAAKGVEARSRYAVTRDGLVAELLRAVDLARERADPMAMVVATREIARICGYTN